MKIQAGASAVLLTGILAGTIYGATLTLLQQQPQQQDNSAQQKGKQSQDDKKKKPNSQSGNANGAQQPQANAQPTNAPPPNNPPPSGNPPPGGDKPTPLFGGTIGLKSSRQTKDSATLGFNGVDPNGQVQKAMLSAAVSPTDAMKAQQLAQTTVTPADLVQFLRDGGLNLSAGGQKP